jgi:hypothetical protein
MRSTVLVLEAHRRYAKACALLEDSRHAKVSRFARDRSHTDAVWFRSHTANDEAHLQVSQRRFERDEKWQSVS